MGWRWGGFRPYVGGGLAIHFVKSQFESPGASPSEESETIFGPNLLLGLQLPTGSWLQPSIQAKYEFVNPVEQFKVNWGLGANF